MRLVSTLLLVSIVFAGSVYAAGQDLVSRGERMLQAGNHNKAAAYFKAAIIRDVTDEAAWAGYRKAVVGLEMGKRPIVAPKPVTQAKPQPVTPDIAPLPQPITPVVPKIDPTKISLDDLTLKLSGPKPTVTPANPGSFDSYNSSQIAPWKGLSVFDIVDPTLMDSPNRARQRFMAERKKLTNAKRTRSQLGVEATVTYYTKNLYKYLAVHMASQNGWTYKHTEMQYVLMSKFARRYHEFSIELREVSSPRRFPYVKDIAKRTYLQDDAGNRYNVVKHAGPSQANLKKADNYSVCFPLKDKDGKPITDKIKKQFFIIIKGLDDNRDIKKIAFNKEVLLNRDK